MTEFDWPTSNDIRPMLEFLKGKISDRKLRLFAVGCCREIWDGISAERSRKAVEVAERFADGEATIAELNQAYSFACEARGNLTEQIVGRRLANRDGYSPQEIRLFIAAESARSPYQASGAEPFLMGRLRWYVSDTQVNQLGPALLRCIAGNPFQPIEIDPRWRTSDVTGIAELIYNERRFDRLPILADALMDGGCEDEKILTHCRDEGPHVRGCWIVDRLLGRS